MMSDNIELDWHLDDGQCPCLGSGWAQNKTEWQECYVHYNGQLMPEIINLLLDDQKQLLSETKKSILKFEINKCKNFIAVLQKEIDAERQRLIKFECELINHTPTIKAMPVVILK